MSLDSIVRAALSLTLIRLPDFEDVVIHIEDALTK